MEIVSILVIVQLENQLNFEVLLDRIEGTKKNEKINFVYKRFQPGNYYVSFYRTGKFLIYGIKSLEHIEVVVENIINTLNRSQISTKLKTIKIGNIVLKDHILLKKPLENIFTSLESSKASYEPGTFPAILYKDHDINYALFSNGKLIITGVKDINKAKDNFNKFSKMIQNI